MSVYLGWRWQERMLNRGWLLVGGWLVILPRPGDPDAIGAEA